MDFQRCVGQSYLFNNSGVFPSHIVMVRNKFKKKKRISVFWFFFFFVSEQSVCNILKLFLAIGNFILKDELLT